MKPLHLLCFASTLLLGVPASQAQANPPPISWSYRGYAETQEWWLEYETLPGWNYLIEESQDLSAWTPMAGGFAYGDGGLKRRFITSGPVPLEQGEPPPPPPPVNPVSKEFRSIPWEVTLSANAASSTIHVKRGALGDFAAWDKVVEIPLPRPQEGSRRCYFLDYEDEAHSVWNEPLVKTATTLEPQPGDTLASAGAQEEFEFAVFQSIVNQLTAWLSMPFAPGQPDTTERPHKFVRIRRASADSNHNGIADWQEIQYGFPVLTAGISGNADEDGDGYTNAQELAAGTDPRTADPAPVILNSSFSMVSVHQCLVAGEAYPKNEENASNGAFNYTGSVPGILIGSGLDSAIGEVWSRAANAASMNHYSGEDRPSAILNAYASGRYYTGASGPRPLTSAYGNSFSSIADGHGMKINLKLSSNRPPPQTLHRRFLPVRRIQSASVPLDSPPPITNWNYTLSPVVTHTLSPSASPAPVESAPVTIARPSINNVADGHQIRSEWTHAEISLRADTSRNGSIGPEDYHAHQPAVYVVNYDHDEARTHSSGHPTEDAVKWTASADTPARHTDGEPLRKLRPANENWEIKITPSNAENPAELTPLRIAPIAFGKSDLKVFLTLPLADEKKVKAFHLYLVKTAANGTKTYQPIWGGCNVDGTATTTAAAPLATAAHPISFAREVDITQFINPSATGYTDSRPAPVPGNMQPPYELVLEGILFRGMPYPEADGYARYGPSSSPNDVFDGFLKLGLCFRTGSGTTMATTSEITGAESWVSLTCVPSIPLDANGNPNPAADLLAFKGNTPETSAQGFGKHALGGRYGHVFTVTNNTDDAHNKGSLRYAIDSPVPRTIVFALPEGTDGTISLDSALFIKDRHCTIAGQTAFRNGSPGICLKNHGLRIDTDDVIVRHLRSRPGNADPPVNGKGGDTDSIAVESVSTRVIIDHCSVSFSSDCLLDIATGKDGSEVYYTRANRAISVTNNLLAWPMDYANHWEIKNGVSVRQEHGYGSLVRGGNGAKVSYWRNFFAHCRARCPRPSGTRPPVDDAAALQLDFVNNVIYSWGDKGNTPNASSGTNIASYDDGDTDFENPTSKFNQESNYYRARLPYPLGTKRWFRTRNPNARAWISGNRIKVLPMAAPDTPADQYHATWVEYRAQDGGILPTEAMLRTGVPAGGFASGGYAVPVTAVIPAQQQVLAKAGASLKRDALDLLLLGPDGFSGEYEILGGTIIDSPAQLTGPGIVNGWPVLKAKTPLTDTDHDGIPDEREPVTAGRTPAWTQDPRNAVIDDDKDGMTNLEKYLNTITP